MKLFKNRNPFLQPKDNSPTNSPRISSSSSASSSSSSPSPTRSSKPAKFRKSKPEFVKRRVKVPLAILERPLMSDTDFIIDARYKNLKLIGSGSYGIVVSAIDTVTGQRVAIKKVLNAFASSRMARTVLREIRLLRHLQHPHIVQLLDIDVPRLYEAWDEVYLVTPLLNTDLRALLNRRRMSDPLLQKKIAYQLLVALRHLHQAGIMHRDVKSRNVLLDDDLNVQLCDLGRSRFYSKTNPEDTLPSPHKEPELSGGISTVIQSAPELSLGAPYNAQVDIWAAGCVIAEMLDPQHRFLFDLTSRHSHIQEIIDIVGFPSDDILEVLPDFGAWYLKKQRRTKNGHNRIGEMLGADADPVAVDLLKQMLKFSPKDRISAEGALEHPWFDDVRESEGGKSAQEAYNFALSEPPKKTARSKLKNLVWEEVVAFHPEATLLGIR